MGFVPIWFGVLHIPDESFSVLDIERLRKYFEGIPKDNSLAVVLIARSPRYLWFLRGGTIGLVPSRAVDDKSLVFRGNSGCVFRDV